MGPKQPPEGTAEALGWEGVQCIQGISRMSLWLTQANERRDGWKWGQSVAHGQLMSGLGGHRKEFGFHSEQEGKPESLG